MLALLPGLACDWLRVCTCVCAQFLPFVWGSAQLVNHPLIRPKSINNEELLGMYGDDYMYLACIKFVKAVSVGPEQLARLQTGNLQGA